MAKRFRENTGRIYCIPSFHREMSPFWTMQHISGGSYTKPNLRSGMDGVLSRTGSSELYLPLKNIVHFITLLCHNSLIPIHGCSGTCIPYPRQNRGRSKQDNETD